LKLLRLKNKKPVLEILDSLEMVSMLLHLTMVEK
jgi:hypothetical protein